jgi:hypothetical protein
VALSQWLTLLLGIAFIAFATGAGTAFQVLRGDRSTVEAIPSSLPVTTEPTTPPRTIPPTEDPAATGTPIRQSRSPSRC